MNLKRLDANTFGELSDSVREGGAILRGQRKASRRFLVEASRRFTIEASGVRDSRTYEPVAIGIRQLHGRIADNRAPLAPRAGADMKVEPRPVSEPRA